MKEFNNMREAIEYMKEMYGSSIAFTVKTKENGNAVYDKISYDRMFNEIKSLGKYFINMGLQQKRIAVIGKNCYKWMLVYFSTLCTNGLIVPLDRGLFHEEIEDQLNRSEADIVFYTSDIKEKMEGLSVRKICMDDEEFDLCIKAGFEMDGKEYDNIKVDGEKLSILLFTSGTTSASKAVMLSQHNITSDMYGMSLWEDFRQSDVNMAILPFHHTFGMTQMVLFMSHGMNTVFCEGLRVAKCLSEYHVSMFVAVPRILNEIYKAIIKALKKQKKLGIFKAALKLSSILKKINIDITDKLFGQIKEQLGGNLRFIIIGAAAADPEVLDFFNNIGILAIQGYGLTETSPCISAENEKNMRKGSVGKAIPINKVKIVNPDENGIGEIVSSGPNVMLGYYKDEEKTAEVIKDGWFYTGDMGFIDKDGYLFITGRKKNVIVLQNGKNVFPEEIELLITKCKCVKECMVFFNESKDCIYSTVVYDKSYDKDDARKEITQHMEMVNSRLPLYKQIRGFDITDKEFDKTSTLKIKRY